MRTRPSFGGSRLPNSEETDTRLVIRKVMASCRCGGSVAWVLTVQGADIMLGCVCHNDPYEVIRRKMTS